jgi:hypothetical protein
MPHQLKDEMRHEIVTAALTNVCTGTNGFDRHSYFPSREDGYRTCAILILNTKHC